MDHSFLHIGIAAGVAIGLAVAIGFVAKRSKKTISVSVEKIPRGSMQEVDVVGSKVLLVHTSSGEYHAVGSKCTHYGAPLEKGVLCGDRVMCPWHAACFNVKTGDVEDAPAFDGLHTFPCQELRNKVVITVPKDMPPNKREPVCSLHSEDTRTFVIVGAGAAGLSAAQTLREEGFGGKIIMISEEQHPPYDRIKLSKNFKVNVDELLLRRPEFYEKMHIDLLLNTRVVGVNPEERIVHVDAVGDNSVPPSISYDSLLISTGGRARSLQEAPFVVPGAEFGNIFTIRVPSDVQQINSVLKQDSRVVVVGSSFIGMEAASYLKQGNKVNPPVIVIGMENVPFERVLGLEIGTTLQNLHQEKGVEFRMKATVQRFEANTDGSVKSVVVKLENGREEVIPADLVIIGAGIICSTQFLEGVDGIELARDKSVIVDETLRVRGVSDVWAAGDIARFPYIGGLAEFNPIRIEHWDVAIQMGKVAAKNMLGAGEAYTTVPFFWTAQYGLSLRYVGNAMAYDRVHVDGDLAARKFVAYYIKNDQILAIVTLGRDPVAVAASELFRLRQIPAVSDIERGADLVKCLENVSATL